MNSEQKVFLIFSVVVFLGCFLPLGIAAGCSANTQISELEIHLINENYHLNVEKEEDYVFDPLFLHRCPNLSGILICEYCVEFPLCQCEEKIHR